MRSIKQHFLEAREAIDRFLSDDSQLAQIEKAGAAMVNAIQKGGKIISCGNGGSMCDAMHFAEELSGRFRNDRKALPAVAISDASHITCSANDYGFEHIFSRYVEALGREGDVLLAISTSGNSANIVEAVKAALAKGITVVGLTGKTGGKMAEMGIIEIRAPYSEYADRAQEIHIKVIHSLIDHIERQLV